MTEEILNTGRGVANLTDAGWERLRRCWEAAPEGCRSADNECGPPPTYPCTHHCNISLDEFWQIVVPHFREVESLVSK